MYHLYCNPDDTYEIHSSFKGDVAMHGTFLAVMVYAVHVLGFKVEELQFAVSDMIRRDLNAAEFGINRAYLFSFNKNEGELVTKSESHYLNCTNEHCEKAYCVDRREFNSRLERMLSKKENSFTQGYFCACAVLAKTYDEPTIWHGG